MLKWTNKIDNVDDILADDINSIAQEVIILQKNINDIDDECDAKIGALDNLETNDKSNLVNAINEIVASGSSSGIIVDQTYNSTSANAQSGKAVAEAIAEVDEKVGDIDTTLDNIIAMQNSYIGGDSV